MITIPGRSYAILSYLIERSIRAVHSIVRRTACITRDVRPNISGTTKILRPESYNGSEDTGSLYLSDFGNEGASGNDYPRRATLNLDSSLSSTLYKNIETIQPTAGYALMIIKE